MTLELSNGDLRVAGSWLLRNVDFCANPYEVVAIIGANGAGKSSLLRVISGDLSPSSGWLTFDGTPLEEFSRLAIARRIAVLPQHSMLDFPFLAREVIEMGRIPHLTGNEQNHRIVAEVIDRLQLQLLADRTYTTLSGGEKQRVQIARTLCQVWESLDQSYLLFDEPTAPLDLAHQLGFLSLARDFAAQGAGLVLVMHDINLAARFADRVVIMKSGGVIAQGQPHDVITSDNLEQAFDVVVEVTTTSDGAPLIYGASSGYGAAH